MQRLYVRRALDQSGGKKQRAAQLLGIKSHQALNYTMTRLGMKAK